MRIDASQEQIEAERGRQDMIIVILRRDRDAPAPCRLAECLAVESSGEDHASRRAVGRPPRVFRRDEVVRLRDQEWLSWPEIARRLELGVGQGTAVRAYRSLTGTTADRKSVV